MRESRHLLLYLQACATQISVLSSLPFARLFLLAREEVEVRQTTKPKPYMIAVIRHFNRNSLLHLASVIPVHPTNVQELLVYVQQHALHKGKKLLTRWPRYSLRFFI
jgi:hypothetical protein